MTSACLSQIIGTAVIDRGFQCTLLNSPERALAQFDLTANEVRDIVAIKATSIEQFAEQLISWMNGRDVDWL